MSSPSIAREVEAMIDVGVNLFDVTAVARVGTRDLAIEFPAEGKLTRIRTPAHLEIALFHLRA